MNPMEMPDEQRHKYHVDRYLRDRLKIVPFKFSSDGICSDCRQYRLLVNHDITTLKSRCYDCFSKEMANYAMTHARLDDKYWKFWMVNHRYKVVEDLLYEYGGVDIRPKVRPDDEEEEDEED